MVCSVVACKFAPTGNQVTYFLVRALWRLNSGVGGYLCWGMDWILEGKEVGGWKGTIRYDMIREGDR